MAELPATIGRFKVLRDLDGGEPPLGGRVFEARVFEARVFEAEDPQLDRTVVVKVLPDASDAVQNGAKAQGQIKDANVVTVHEVGPFEGGFYVAMELVDGPTLEAWLGEEGRSWRAVLDTFVQAGRGLAAAHKRGLVHGNFTPASVLIDEESGRARVADFGLAAEPSDDVLRFRDALRDALGPSAPARVRRALARDCADMPTLLRRLERAAAPRRALPAAIAVVAVGVAAAVLWPQPRDCAAESSLAGVWDDAVRDASAERAGSSEASYVAGAWPATARALDDYATTWVEQRRRACEVADTRTDALAEKSLDCLAARREDLATVTERVVAGDEDVLSTALHLATGFPSPQTCNDEARLASWIVPENDAARARRETARGALRTATLELAAARTGGSAGAYEARLDTATEAAQAARAGAVDSADPGLEARALYVLGQLAQHGGDSKQAEEFLKLSAARAEAARDDRARVRALSFQVFAIGTDPDRIGEVLQVAAQAESALSALGDPPRLRAQLASNLGTVKARAQPPDPEGAIANHREALSLLTASVGERHPDVLSARVNFGNTLGRLGDLEASRVELVAAAEAAPQLWGPEHPLTARVEGTLGLALLRSGDHDGARETLQSALGKSRAALGDEHPQVLDGRYNLALALRRLGEHAAAAEHLRIGLEVRRRLASTEAGALARWHYVLGRELNDTGDVAGAEDVLREALALCESDGAKPVDFARIRFALAKAIVASRPAHAKQFAELALETFRAQSSATEAAEVDAFLQKVMSSSERGATSNPL